MSNTTNAERLARLNAFRAHDGLPALKDWRNARHTPMLNAYLVMQDAKADAGDADDFEMEDAELDAQKGRDTADIKRDEQLETEVAKPKRVIKKGNRPAPSTTEKTLAEVAGSADFANHTELQARAAELAKTKSYKQVARYDKSAVEKPVAFIHQFLSDNPGMTRKQAVIALTEGYGINYSTARTQYQRWYAAKKKGA